MEPERSSSVPPFHGSCSRCDYSPMFPLARFFEDDVNEKATLDSYVPSAGLSRTAPDTGIGLMIVSWLSALLWDKGRVARGRAKVSKARRDILPRCPHAVICPRCFEVLERL